MVAIVRAASTQVAAANVATLIRSGLAAVEVSLVTPGALGVIRDAVSRAPAGTMVGVGTALSVGDVESAVDAGARFVVTPTTDRDVIRAAVDAGVPVLPGAATPTEAVQALNWGATFVKLFPASLWTPAAMRDVLTALPDLPLVPTGGVDPENAAEWMRAGAVALGIGSALTGSDDPAHTAAELLSVIAEARASR
ncbi:hypothetical protein ASF80_08380 [Microbacterium sp. Leaf159]|nr:hypothetical protein ASF80_08380 [Microbacterium sp. Leaf159]